ncbi:proline--tRNA ligase [Candidatus Enterococcus ferrettii]|uniref:Proline--tRNA ligase n=1 Tax=Candidatus Enterococcus ferrettii TaxID=2815324 RepID=A0ABV0ETB3_9ENTE|nr:proline--tRNA ligase [Enterococcus sp. 665A]MBO1340247.1 proline--tRNA ligase [Enterococcus sp. 665A]
MTRLQKEDFSSWYLQTIQQAELMSYSEVRGCIVFRPDGFELWERIQAEVDAYLREEDIRNVYFPMLIPKSYFMKEAEHVEGFAPELPWVTSVGEEELEEPYALRPTSETMIGKSFHEWIKSYRDLPYEINQWANVFRWEKRTLPFSRTSEFLWHEGHTAHADEADARRRTLHVLNFYVKMLEEFLAIPVHAGQKTPSERFAGAVDTFSIEAMMKDGKAVQAGTSHYLGTKFAEAFDIKYLNQENQHTYVHTTSWAVSTRLIGAIIMVHGDEKGLVLPPKIAPTQVILTPVGPWKKEPKILETLHGIQSELKAADLRVRLDDSDSTPGFKFNKWEQKGAALRIELGPRDFDQKQFILKMRDLDTKETHLLDHLTPSFIQQKLDQMHDRLLINAQNFARENEHLTVETLADLKNHIKTCEEKQEIPGFVLIGWDGSEETESRIKEETGFTTRNIPFDPPIKKKYDLVSGKPAKHTVWIARAY